MGHGVKHAVYFTLCSMLYALCSMPERNTHMTANNKATIDKRKVALGKRLRHSPLVHTLGLRPNISDYSEIELDLLRNADTIYYPSTLYEDIFLALGKRVFPANFYRYMGDKIKQTELFTLLGIPHPRTRIYRDTPRVSQILADFSFPFIAKIPRGSSKGRGVFLIRSREDLQDYLQDYAPAYIQEYLPIDRDLRVVLVGQTWCTLTGVLPGLGNFAAMSHSGVGYLWKISLMMPFALLNGWPAFVSLTKWGLIFASAKTNIWW